MTNMMSSVLGKKVKKVTEKLKLLSKDPEIHPELLGEFWDNGSGYSWPDLPKFPADRLGEQQDLFNEES